MALSECPSIGCDNKVTSAFSCSVCDSFKCIECMTESTMSICVDCEAREIPSNSPDFSDWEGGSLRDWFYHGFISTFFERCERGQVFEIYCPFADTASGFTITLPPRYRSWSELEESIEEAKRNPNYAQWLLNYAFVQYDFVSGSSIEEAFETLKQRVKVEDPWWNGLEFEILRFENNYGPLPWQDHGRVIVTLDMGKNV